MDAFTFAFGLAAIGILLIVAQKIQWEREDEA